MRAADSLIAFGSSRTEDAPPVRRPYVSRGQSGGSSSDNDDPVVVYRTRLLLEIDVVADAMSRAQMPYFRRIETVGGLAATIPASPPPGLLPGSFFAIAVPGEWVARARRFIATLPVSQEVRDIHQMPGVKDMFKGWTWVFVLAIILTLIIGVIRMYLLE